MTNGKNTTVSQYKHNKNVILKQRIFGVIGLIISLLVIKNIDFFGGDISALFISVPCIYFLVTNKAIMN